ncbi:alpha/beta hydrolase [Candidatus Microgenomates bacterium]|nr:alpha/beta hydrolase [Candidatus Microgenomates bacterium]
MKFKTVKGEIDYGRMGNSDCPTFLFPPFPGSQAAFKPLINEVKKSKPDFDFVNFTLPGLGGHTKLVDKNIHLKVKDYSALISDFISSFNLKEYNVLAASLGGYFASYMLAKNMTKPKKIILMSPLLNPKKILNHSLKFQRILLTSAHQIGLPLKILLAINYAYIWCVEWRKKKDSPSNKFIKEAQKDFENTCGEESFYLFEEIGKKDESNIEKFKKNTLVVVGDQDIPDIIDECKKLESEGFKLEIIKNGTHGYMFLDPAQTAAHLIPFLT